MQHYGVVLLHLATLLPHLLEGSFVSEMAAGRLKKEKLSDVHLYNEDDENTTFLENESDGAHGVVTPLPKKKIITLFILLFANAAVSTSPFPFLPFMVQDLGVAPQNAGYVAHDLCQCLVLGYSLYSYPALSRSHECLWIAAANTMPLLSQSPYLNPILLPIVLGRTLESSLEAAFLATWLLIV